MLGVFGSLSDGKFNLLAFIQVAEAITNNRGVMYEYVIAGLALDEVKALRAVEPLHKIIYISQNGGNMLICPKSI